MINTDVADNVRGDIIVLEERYNIWKENRLNTIVELRDIADYVDKVTKDVGIAKVIVSLSNKSYA